MPTALTLALTLLTAEPAPRRSVVLATDCGVECDDQWALTHLALCPELELKGVVATHAPTLPAPAAESAARAARGVLDRLNLKARPPVFAGSSVPLKAESRPLGNRGVDFVIEQSRNHSSKDRLVVLVIGAATDVASALRSDPKIADRIEVVAMGFSGWPEGGDPWNVKNDVKAWRVLIESPVPIVVGDAAVTRRDLAMTPAEARRRFGGRGEAGEFLVKRLETWLAENSKMAEEASGAKGTWPIWDEVVVAYLLGMTKHDSRPRPRLRDGMIFDRSSPRGTIVWITAIDSERLWTDLAARLDRAR